MRVLSAMMMVWTDSWKKEVRRGLCTTLVGLIWAKLNYFDVEE